MLACAACETDFSPHWQEQLDALMDAGARPGPPLEDAGQPDSAMPAPPGPDAALPQGTLDCVRKYRCDQADPGCLPLCLVSSLQLDGCMPGEECRAADFSPVRCEHCRPEPIK